MKRILLSLLFAQGSCFFAVYGAAAGDSCEESGRKRIAVDTTRDDSSLESKKSVSAEKCKINLEDLSIKNCITPQDYEEIKALYIECGIENCKADKSTEEKKVIYEQMFNIYREDKYHNIIQIRMGDKPIGYFELKLPNNFVLYLYIDKSYRGNKIGLRMLDLFAKQMKKESLALIPKHGLEPYYQSGGFNSFPDGWGSVTYVKNFPKK